MKRQSGRIDPSVFKAYDIRGQYGKNITEEFAYLLGRGYATLRLREEKGKNQELTLAVGRDMRLSSPALSAKLIQGITESGVNVVDFGLVSTPTFYFGTAFYKYGGGIQVSASHNPKNDNGFKLVRSRAVPVSANSGIYDLREIVIRRDFIAAKHRGKITNKFGILEELIKNEPKFHHVEISKIKPLTIAVDTANGMAALDIDAMFKTLPCKLIKLNFQLDGSFPAHQADPLDEKNLLPLQEAVKKTHADLGIAPDGDGDRYFFIDEQGKVLRQEILRGIMAQLTLKDFPNSTICYDIRPGRITLDMIKAAGGKPSVTKVGHSLIKEQMLRENAVFGGESSGHYFYRFPYGTFESPVILTLKFLSWLSEKNQPLSQLIKPYQKYFHSGEINSVVKDKKAAIKAIKNKYSDADEVSFLDGISIRYKDFWFNVRPSNTESKLRLNLEAISPQTMEKKRDEVLNLIRSQHG